MGAEAVTIRDLLGRLTIRQLWATLGALVVFVTGVFGLGYKMGTFVVGLKDVEVRELRKRLEAKESALKEMNEKDKFLSLYLRYAIAKDNWEKNVDDEGKRGEFVEARRAFDEYVIERVGKEKLVLRKGEKRLAVIQFEDGTKWTIPRELHAAAKR